jgi:D-alanyl-D-alanine dipeptidase
MKRLLLSILCILVLTGCAQKTQVPETTVPMIPVTTDSATVPQTEPVPEPEDGDFVKVADYIPQIQVDLRYATEQNFTGKVIYRFQDAYLRYGTVKKLMAVCSDLAELDLCLKIWDGFRPVSAQFVLWEVYPDSRYVANPTKGYSSHSRGNTVDVTLVDSRGQELEMPTQFDDFSAKADRDYSDCTQIQRNNARILEVLMEKHGFAGYAGEWWHFSDTVTYPVEDVFDPAA